MGMRFGIYLKGGGAKGAFQAGVLCAFWQRGVEYSVVGGTSIGAINGWHVLHGAYEELENLYMNMSEDYANLTFSGKVIDHSFLMDQLKKVSGDRSQKIDAFYVNYAKVQDGQLVEVTENIRDADVDYAMKRIAWSSLLPYNYEPMSFQEFRTYAENNDLSIKFQKDLANKVYDGLHLDGGMINNNLIKEIFNHPSERTIVIGYNGTRDEYCKSIEDLPVSHREQISYISADEPFKVSDTYNFTPEFLKERFQKGYELGIHYPLIKLISR